MQKFLQQLVPFLILGIIIVVLIAGVMLFSYLLIFGSLVGLVLFGINWFKEKLFPSKNLTRTKQTGRTFDNEE